MIAFGALTLIALLSVPMQQIRERDIVIRGAALPHEFDDVFSVRELENSDVLITDRGQRVLYVANFTSGTVRQVGRDGNGPGEYRSPGHLIALNGDSTLLVDLGSRRWLFLRGAALAGQWGPDAFHPRHLGNSLAGAGSSGKLLSVRGYATAAVNPFMRGAPVEFPEGADSMFILVAPLKQQLVDTVGTIRGGFAGPPRTIPRQSGGVTVQHVLRGLLRSHDQAILFPDGAIAIARLEPYSVQWILPNGRRRPPIAIPTSLQRVTQEEKVFAIAEAYSRTTPRWTPEQMPNWPSYVPAFPARALLAGPSGELVIRRTRTSTDSVTRYDVLDRNGRLAERLTLDRRARIVGFGSHSAYVVRRDHDDIERITRIPWP